MQKNEFKRIIDEIKLGDHEIKILYDTEEEFDLLKKVFPKNTICFERPDMLSIIDKHIIPIEHFEFDSGDLLNNKGSKFKKSEKDFITALYNESKNKNSLQKTEEMQISISSKNYIDNLLRVFNKHYNKIDKYLENIKNKYNDYIIENVWFFIEESLPFVSQYNEEDIYLIFVKQFIDKLEQSSKLGGILFKTTDHDGKKVIFVFRNTPTNIKYLRENEFDMEDKNISLPQINIIGLVEDSLEKLEKNMNKLSNEKK